MKIQTTDSRGPPNNTWLAVICWYLPTVFLADLVWETLHLPLYTVWAEGTPQYLVFVVLHCTGGDLLIALASLSLALIIAAPGRWLARGFVRVATFATSLGIAYTIFSEWLNLVVRKSWAYSDLMPVVPVIDTGLSPLLQWIVVPPISLWGARHIVLSRSRFMEATS